jgi:hypothetical protein
MREAGMADYYYSQETKLSYNVAQYSRRITMAANSDRSDIFVWGDKLVDKEVIAYGFGGTDFGNAAVSRMSFVHTGSTTALICARGLSAKYIG